VESGCGEEKARGVDRGYPWGSRPVYWGRSGTWSLGAGEAGLGAAWRLKAQMHVERVVVEVRVCYEK